MQIGERLDLLIYEMGFTSVEKFAKYMKEKMPRDYVSEDTILNVIKGKKVRKETLQSIAKGLELPIEVLITKKIVKLDNYLIDEVKPQKEVKNKRGNKSNEKHVNNPERVKFLIDLSKNIYRDNISERFGVEHGYHITTPAEYDVYSPLFKPYIHADIVCRIDADIIDREVYFFDKYEDLYHEIPDIPAKRWADYRVIELRLEGKYELSEKEKELEERLKKYRKSKEYQSDYKQYQSIAKRNYDLHHNDVIRSIFESYLPELYEEEIKWRNEYLKMRERT